MPRMMWILLALLCLSSCKTTNPVPSQPRSLGGLVIRCEPMDAKIFVNDQYLGQVSALTKQPLHLPAGLHRVEIRRDGFFSHYTEVTIDKGVRQKLTVKLRKEPY